MKNEQGLFVEKEFDCELNDAVSLLLIEDSCKELETQGLGKLRQQFEGIRTAQIPMAGPETASGRTKYERDVHHSNW